MCFFFSRPKGIISANLKHNQECHPEVMNSFTKIKWPIMLCSDIWRENMKFKWVTMLPVNFVARRYPSKVYLVIWEAIMAFHLLDFGAWFVINSSKHRLRKKTFPICSQIWSSMWQVPNHFWLISLFQWPFDWMYERT